MSYQEEIRGNISSIFSSNSEAFASELLENIEEISPGYYIDSNVINMLQSSITHWCATRRKGLRKCMG